MAPRKQLLRWMLAAVLVVAGVAAVPGEAARQTSNYPLLTVEGDAHGLGAVVDLDFGASYMSWGGETGRLVIDTPRSFGASVIRPSGAKLGEADLGVVTAPGGQITSYTGALRVLDPAIYALNSGAQACAPGSHTATWVLALTGRDSASIDIPVAVDARAGGYRLTLCFFALHAMNRQLEYLDFTPDGMFRNAAHTGDFLFDGTVTPLASDGTLDTSSTYELRAYKPLPESLSAYPTYDAIGKTLIVTGAFALAGVPRKHVAVYLYGGQSERTDHLTPLGSVLTDSSGHFSFTKHQTSLQYPWVSARFFVHSTETCLGSSPDPGGCASVSVDGVWSYPEKVAPPLVKITARSAPPELTALLLPAAAVAALPDSPAPRYTVVPIQKAGLTKDPDARTACGRPIADWPSLNSGAISYLNGTNVGLVQWAGRLPAANALGVVTSLTAGTSVGCKPYTDSTGQTEHLVAVVHTQATPGDHWYAAIGRVTNGSEGAWHARVALQHGSYLLLEAILTAHRPTATFLTGLAKAAAVRLDALPDPTSGGRIHHKP